MNSCHRCGVPCDAYQHQAVEESVTVYFCTFFCAQFWHFATGIRVLHSTRGMEVFPPSPTRVSQELKGHDHSKHGFRAHFVAVEATGNGRYTLPPPVANLPKLGPLEIGETVARILKGAVLP